MGETLLIPTGGGLYRDAPTHTVSTRQTWGDAWTVQPHLYANMCRWGSGPVRSEAQLYWRYGEGMRPGESVYGNHSSLDLLGRYVMVQIQQEAGEDPLRWYGICTDSARRRDGGADQLGTLIKTGHQTLVAEGLDLLLLRTFFNWSYVRKAGDYQDRTRIERGLTFNDPNTFADTGNRSSSKQDVYIFARDLDDANWWSTRDIIEYLLQHHAPRDARGQKIINWKLSNNAKTVLPTWDRPVVRAHGRSIRSIINELCDRQRLLSWSVRPEDANANTAILLDVASFNASPILLPSGKTQQANQDQIQLGSDGLELDRAVDVRVGMREDDHARVEQVVIRGGRKRAVGSLSKADATLAADWKDADETAYEAGPSGIGGLDVHEQEQRIKEWRAEERFARVFSWFRLPADWDGKVGDGVGGNKSNMAPDNEVTGKPETVYLPELRFERSLPRWLADTAPIGSPNQAAPPLAVIQLKDGVRYEHVERLAVSAGIEGLGEGEGLKWSASMRVQRYAPGVVLQVSGSGSQHVLAGDDFTEVSGISDDPAELDWETLIVTVMLELDSCVEQRYPATADLPAGDDAARVVYVDLGDRARLDWVHPAAVVGVLDGVLQYRNGATPGYQGEYLADDREAMLDLAKFMYEWYGTAREAFTVELKQLSGICHVGDLITRIGHEETAETVNALVTGVEMDLLAGTTRITTGYGELDPIQLF